MKQSYQNVEIIIVNDGSTDQTGEVLESLKKEDDRIIVIHKENGGVTSARLEGVKSATGEYIGFVDGDDMIEAEMYEILLKSALTYKADISHCGYQRVFPNGCVEYYYNTGCFVQQDRLTGLKDLLTGSFIEPGLCNKLFHKNLLHSLFHQNVMKNEIKINEDLLMNYYLFKEASLSVYQDICPYHYMLRKESASTAKMNRNKLLDPLAVAKIIHDDVKGNQELEAIMLNRIARQLINIATINKKENEELIIPYQKVARKELRKLLPNVIGNKKCGKREKILVVWAAVLPTLYRWVHNMYEKRKEIDKKHSLD